MKTILTLTTAASLIAGTAMAQTAQPKSTETSPSAITQSQHTKNATMSAEPVLKGIVMADTASQTVRFVSSKPADIMTSKLVGLTVYNNQKDKLGEIEDLTIENGKTVTGVVVSVGGFLGMGERYVLVDPATLVVSKTDGSWKAYVNTTKDTLKNAPKFEYTAKHS
jgi:sporulation protein YlmC with PRC-barrel domain